VGKGMTGRQGEWRNAANSWLLEAVSQEKPSKHLAKA